MVFGWGKKKEAQEQPAPLQSKEIPLSEIPQILLNHKESKQKRIIDETGPLFSKIKADLDAINAIIDHLKNDDLNLDDVDTRLRVIVVRGKKDVVETISKEANLVLPKVDSYESLVRCSDATSHVLKKIGDVLGKNTRIIHLFAKKYAQDLKEHLEHITSDHFTISNMMQKLVHFESTESSIKEKIHELLTIEQDVAEKETLAAKSKDLLAKHAGTIASTEQALSETRSSQEYAEFLQSKQELERLGAMGRNLDKEIDDEFSKISRPLGKYVYVTSLDKPHKIVLEKLIRRPSEALETESRESITTVLESCMKGVISGTVSVKENEKSVDQITHIISLLDEMISKKSQHASKIKQAQQALTVFDPVRIVDLEKRLKGAKTDKENAESKIRILESEIEQQKKQKDHLLEKITMLLENAVGTKYSVVIR